MNKKRLMSFYRLVCAISVVCLLVPPAWASWRLRAFAGAECLAALICACAVLLALPVVEEPAKLSLRYAAAMAAACLGGVLAARPVPYWLTAVLAIHLAYLIHRSVEHYAQLRPLFRHFAVWYNLENHARCLYSLALYMLALLSLAGAQSAWLGWLLTALALTEFVLLLVRVRTGRTMFLDLGKEVEIKELIRGNLRTAPAQTAEQTEDVARMTRVYARIVAYMEQKRPFLDDEFALDDMSAAIFTNKSYLSKTINVMSGRNFSQFVNYYRVQYSRELMRKDPHLKVTDLALMSGFHTTVTFTMAFKLNYGETPSQYLEHLRSEKRWH